MSASSWIRREFYRTLRATWGGTATTKSQCFVLPGPPSGIRTICMITSDRAELFSPKIRDVGFSDQSVCRRGR